MKLWKGLKRKAGNALITVVGTILGLTILAGTVVGVALNSTKLVYREKNLGNQNDARQILYIAAKYFCEQMNEGKSPSVIREELQNIFGPGLRVTKDSESTDDIYYIWYPNSYKPGYTEYVPGEDCVQEWLKATINKKETNDDGGDHGDSGINNTLFSQEAKIDEKFAIGNMMTVYLTDEQLLPGRRYKLNEVSLVESDIDTFDEAFTYMNNTGVLEIDDIGLALYKYGVISTGSVSYIDTPESASQPYKIVYKTGNLGGNYYWLNGTTDYESWIYRQEYDIDLLYEMLCYYDSSVRTTISKSNLAYSYDDANDSHRIYSKRTADDFVVTYSSSQRFAEALADYIFWENLPRLCMLLSDFQTVIYNLVDQKVYARYSSSYYVNIWKHTYAWNNAGLVIYPYFTDYDGSWYSEYPYDVDGIKNVFKNNNTLNSKYCTSNELDRTKMYNELVTKYTATAKKETNYSSVLDKALTYYTKNSNNMLELQNGGKISYTDSTLQTGSMYKNYQIEASGEVKKNKWKLTNFFYKDNNNNSVIKTYDEWKDFYNRRQYSDDDFPYFYDSNYSASYRYFNPNFYKKSNEGTFDYTLSTGNNTLTQQVIDYINQKFVEKYVTGNNTMRYSGLSSDLSFGEIIGDEESGKMICQPQWYVSNGKMHILFHFNVVVKRVETSQNCDNKNFVEKYRYEVQNWSSENSGDSFDMSFTDFINTFADGITDIYADDHMTQQEIEQYSQQVDVQTLTRNYLKKQLVDPIRYQYLPTTTLGSIVENNNTTPGMEELTMNNKLVKYYLENATDTDINAIGDDADYTIEVTNSYYLDNLSSELADYLNYVVEFKIKVDANKDKTYETTITRKVSFIVQFMTYNAQNNAQWNSSTKQYEDVLNRNVTNKLDSDGTYKNFFSAVPIKNQSGQTVKIADLKDGTVPAIVSNLPYTERINSNQVKYGDHKVSIDGRDYNVTTNVNDLKNVTSNLLYNGPVESLPETNFKIKVAQGVSLFINGNLYLKDDQDMELGKDALLFVNGNFEISYRYTQMMDYDTSWGGGRTYYTRRLTDSNYNYFVAHGVDVTAGANAKIMVNGNMKYRGFKGKYATSSSGYFTIHNTDGTDERVKLDTIYEQFVFNRGVKNSTDCSQNEETGKWTHYPYECRGALEGIYIVNGDCTFHAWDEKNTTDNSYSNTVAMYRNLYSNPIIKGTFYVDGTFDMRGLYTSGLYDPCRANFVFAKSIVEPYIALNTILCAGANSNYAAWQDSDGYLFMICEDAIDFSKVNFACVNLFTPFQELVNAINANKESATNFSEFIEKAVFTAMYPDKKVIDEWGLPSILRTGFAELYVPGDIGQITTEPDVYGTEQ